MCGTLGSRGRIRSMCATFRNHVFRRRLKAAALRHCRCGGVGEATWIIDTMAANWDAVASLGRLRVETGWLTRDTITNLLGYNDSHQLTWGTVDNHQLDVAASKVGLGTRKVGLGTRDAIASSLGTSLIMGHSSLEEEGAEVVALIFFTMPHETQAIWVQSNKDAIMYV